MKVFALPHDFHKRGYTYADARMARAANQRGEVPDTTQTPPSLPPALVVQLRSELAARDDMVKALTTEWDEARGQKKLLERQLAEKEAQIRQLYRALARYEAQDDDKS